MSCVSCRSSKTKCGTHEPGTKCPRCERLGIKCLPCPPSRRGLTHPNRLGAFNRSLLEKPAPPIGKKAKANANFAMAACQLTTPVMSELATSRAVIDSARGVPIMAFGGCAAVRAMVSGWAAVAGQRNSHRLLKVVLGMAETCGIPVAIMMNPPAGSRTPLARLTSQCPPQVAALLQALHSRTIMIIGITTLRGRHRCSSPAQADGYVWARSVVANTALGAVAGFVSNGAFERDIATASDLSSTPAAEPARRPRALRFAACPCAALQPLLLCAALRCSALLCAALRCSALICCAALRCSALLGAALLLLL